jgi:manganese transport protein
MFIVYLGPALIVSMAYMDPGNYGTDIQAGASFNYDLVWAVFLASMMAMLHFRKDWHSNRQEHSRAC